MAFPDTLDPTAPADLDSPAFGAFWLRTHTQWLIDLFGLPVASAITGAIVSMGTNVDGKVALDTLVKGPQPFKRFIGTEASGRDYQWVENAGILCLQVNTGTEGVPIWNNVWCINLATGNITGTGIDRGALTFGSGEVSKPVTFGVAQPNTAYYVTLGVGLGTGTPNQMGAVWKTKLTTGFTVDITADPGGGNTIIVDWHLTR